MRMLVDEISVSYLKRIVQFLVFVKSLRGAGSGNALAVDRNRISRMVTVFWSGDHFDAGDNIWMQNHERPSIDVCSARAMNRKKDDLLAYLMPSYGLRLPWALLAFWDSLNPLDLLSGANGLFTWLASIGFPQRAVKNCLQTNVDHSLKDGPREARYFDFVMHKGHRSDAPLHFVPQRATVSPPATVTGT